LRIADAEFLQARCPSCSQPNSVKALKELCKRAARLEIMHELGSQESGISGYSAPEIRNTGSSCYTLEKIK